MFVDPATPSKHVFEEAAPYFTAFATILAAVLAPILARVIIAYDRHEKRKRVMELAEKRLSFWKIKAEVQRTCYPEEDTSQSVRAAVCKIEQDANEELERLVWMEKLKLRYSPARMNLLLYKPSRFIGLFRTYRVIYWLLVLSYLAWAFWFIWILFHYPLPNDHPLQIGYLKSVVIYLTVFYVLGIASVLVRTAAQNLSRPEPPLYESI